MSDLDVKEIREKLKMSQERFAKLLGVTSRTVQNWESGGVIPQTKIEMLHEISQNPGLYFGGKQQNVNGNNISGGRVTLQQSTDKLIELLCAKEATLSKAQEHIDRLMTIIENMQKQQ